MKKAAKSSKFKDFKEFYTELVEPLRKAHPEWIRLDGKTGSGTQSAFGYFQFDGVVWKVEADTEFEKLKLAFLKFEETNEPFEVKPTQGGKNKCLVITGEPPQKKKFYVYATDRKNED